MQLEFLVEEPSAEQALLYIVPKITDAAFRVHPFNGKNDLLSKLRQRLKAYNQRMKNGEDIRIIILVDRDDDNCHDLKVILEEATKWEGLVTKSSPAPSGVFHVLTRIAVEELEAWFLGDEQAIRTAYTRVPIFAQQREFRDPDAVRGGTWEALERLLQKAGYHQGGLAKIKAAREIATHMEPSRNRSRSFQIFCEGLQSLIQTT